MRAAEVVFKDDFSRPGALPASASISLESVGPQVGAPYTGAGTVFDAKQAQGTAADAGAALGGKNFAQAPSAEGAAEAIRGTRWHLDEAGQAALKNSRVLISFDFYMVGGDGSKNMNLISFQDGGTGGRGFDIALKDDGTVTWHDGIAHSVPGLFPTNMAVKFELMVNFAGGYFEAKIGDLRFSGNLEADAHNDFFYDPNEASHVGREWFSSLLFYNTTGLEFFYNNAEIVVLPGSEKGRQVAK